MIVVASANGERAVDLAWSVMSAGGSALDAVEQAARMVEDDPADRSVGTGGLPNLAGRVQLDASIMDGRARRAGAVACLEGFRHPVSVARAVMERLPHVLVVGEGASEFAREIGAETAELLTAEAEGIWRDGLTRAPEGLAGSLLAQLRMLGADPEHVTGTVDFLAMDRDGHLASSVSTSGWAWKWPGRVGDSPLPGAGNYCDDRYGAAACTGLGELAIRAQSARSVVAALAGGAAVEDAAAEAIRDLGTLGEPAERLVMHLVALDRAGRHVGVSTRPGTWYAWRDEACDSTRLSPRMVVPVGGAGP